MADMIDIIPTMLREMRAEIKEGFAGVNRRLEALEAAQKSFRHALTADSLLSKLVTGEFQQRIEALEEKVERLETGK